MAGIAPISGFSEVPDHQFKAAMVRSFSDKAAMGTGTAKKHLETLEQDMDSVKLSSRAGLDGPDESALMKDDAEQQAQEQEDDGKQLQQKRQNSVSGHAATSLGSRDKDYEKAARKGLVKESQDEIMGDTVEDLEFGQAELRQAFIAGTAGQGALMKKLTTVDESLVICGESDQESEDRETLKKLESTTYQAIERIMSRSPEEILADIPEQFRVAAQLMVRGQIGSLEKPRESLTTMKIEPGIQSAALELLPEDSLDIMDIAVENPPIPDLSGSGSSAAA